MTDKLAEIERHAHGSQPDYVYVTLLTQDEVNWLIAEVKWLRIAEQRRTEEVQTAMAEVVRLRAALREALEKATGCAPADRLHELEPLWAVLGDDKEC